MIKGYRSGSLLSLYIYSHVVHSIYILFVLLSGNKRPQNAFVFIKAKGSKNYKWGPKEYMCIRFLSIGTYLQFDLYLFIFELKNQPAISSAF